MFDDNNINDFDLLTKSILKDAEETPPAHIWEGVSKGIDKAAGKKTVVLWFRRAVITTAAAAAAIGAWVMFDTKDAEDGVNLLQSDPTLVSVVERAETETDKEMNPDIGTEVSTNVTPTKLVAMADIKRTHSPKATTTILDNESTMTETVEVTATPQTGEISDETEVTQTIEKPEVSDTPVNDQSINTAPTSGSLSEDSWEEERIRERKSVRTSLVISGVAGTNNPQNKSGIGPFKSPGILKAPTKTTLEQVGGDKHFGIPVSVGVGVKINFTDRWALGVGVNYTLLTSSFNGKYTKVDEGIVSPSVFAETRNKQHYLGIPVNAYFNIIHHDFVNFYAYAGGTVEKCLQNKYQILSEQGTINHTEKAKGVQLSADLGIGVEFRAGKHLGIYVDPSLRYYFKGNQPPSIRTSQPLMLGFEMGLRVNL